MFEPPLGATKDWLPKSKEFDDWVDFTITIEKEVTD